MKEVLIPRERGLKHKRFPHYLLPNISDNCDFKQTALMKLLLSKTGSLVQELACTFVPRFPMLLSTRVMFVKQSYNLLGGCNRGTIDKAEIDQPQH